jgi:hypothetical protein
VENLQYRVRGNLRVDIGQRAYGNRTRSHVCPEAGRDAVMTKLLSRGLETRFMTCDVIQRIAGRKAPVAIFKITKRLDGRGYGDRNEDSD